MTPPTSLDDFAARVGTDDPICCEGGRSQWGIGGEAGHGVRVVRAPAGVVEHEPAEMTVRVGAGTTVDALQEHLAAAGQRVLLPEVDPGATVGGVLAVGRADHRALGWGPVRDSLLEVRYVSAEGRVVRAGGPTVKNVSGFDLCRLMVGALGTLGLLGEVVLRTQPRAEASAWWSGAADPWELRGRLHHPVAVLWDGTQVWVGLEGHAVDVEAEGRLLEAAGCSPASGPPALPIHRWSVDPADLRDGDPAWGAGWVAEIGVGVVHSTAEPPVRPVPSGIVDLHRRVKERFDPTGRLNPGRDPLGVG